MQKNETKKAKPAEDVLVTHVFDAPRELVFRAWTDPEMLAKWYAPEGCNIVYKEIDVRKGGRFLSCVHHPVHGDCWCKGTYLEIDAPSRFVFTAEITNERGEDIQPVDAGMPADWPAKTTVSITFTGLGDKTSITLHQTVAAALAKQTGALPSWIEMFNRLNQLL